MLTDGPLTVDRKEGSTPETTIFSLSGPLTLRNMFDFQSQLRSGPTPAVTILDISQVPYMDSAGMGLVMNQYVHCKTKGLKLIVAGANNRVMDLFEVTKVSTILPLAATVEEAESQA
jgi:anti-sigma B factor antagonist